MITQFITYNTSNDVPDMTVSPSQVFDEFDAISEVLINRTLEALGILEDPRFSPAVAREFAIMALNGEL